MSEFTSKVAENAKRQNRAMTLGEAAQVKVEYRQWLEAENKELRQQLTTAQAENEALREALRGLLLESDYHEMTASKRQREARALLAELDNLENGS